MMRNTILMLLAVGLLGCAKSTEEQRLARVRDSLKCKTYRFTSEKTVGIVVSEYNKRTAPPINDTLVHSTLGLVWFLSEKNEYSFVEAELAAFTATNDFRVLALGLQSIALSKMKCPGLAKSRYDELKALLSTQQGIDTNKVEVEHKAMLLSLIAVSLYHGDPDLAKYGADALGEISELDYLPPLVGAVVEAKKGNPIKAVDQLRELNKSNRFSEHKKAILSEMADIIANSPSEKMEQDVTNRVLLQLVSRVLGDVFSTENQRLLLEKVKTLPELMTGKTGAQPSSAGDVATRAAPEK